MLTYDPAMSLWLYPLQLLSQLQSPYTINVLSWGWGPGAQGDVLCYRFRPGLLMQCTMGPGASLCLPSSGSIQGPKDAMLQITMGTASGVRGASRPRRDREPAHARHTP